MKKILFSISTLLTVSSLFFTGCKKDDTEAPVITVAGDNPYRLEMRKTYVDPGVSASDNEDGNVAVVTDASDLNKDLPGSYEIYYSATDAAGNTGDASRTVDVYATPAALVASYTVKDTCTVGGASIPYSYTQTITTSGTSAIAFNKFADYSGNTGITATIAESGTITLPLQSGLNIGNFSEDHDFQGTGSVTSTGFVITYTDKNNSSVPVSTATCKAYFTRL